MKVFQMIRRHYATLGISSSHQSTQKYPFNEKVAIGFSLYGCTLIFHFIYVFHVASGYMEYVESISATCASLIPFSCYAIFVYKSNTIFKIIDSLEKLIGKRLKYRKSKKFFLKTNQQVERFSEIIFFVIVKVILQVAMLPKLIISFGVYFNTYSGSDSFELPYPLWFPFDSNNPIGYSIAFILEYVMFSLEFFLNSCSLLLGVGLYCFVISACKEIRHILRIFNDKVHKNENQSTKLKLLAELINVHGALRQIVCDSSSIFQPIFLTLFTWTLLAISSTLLIVHAQILHHGSYMELFLPITNAFLGLTFLGLTVFISCEIGQRIINDFDKIIFAFDQSDWYLYPLEVQRMLPMIISIVQEPALLECFGSISCTRDTFKNVVNRSFSYFMTLRNIGE